MKSLPQRLKHDRFDIHLLERVGDVVLLEKSRPHWTVSTFEVCIIRKCPDRIIAGRTIPAHETLPSSEHWGWAGWSYPDLARARRRFSALVQTRAALSTQTRQDAPQLAASAETAEALTATPRPL